MTGPLLSVRDLVVEFHTARGRVPVLHGVSFDVQAGRTLGIVGESGSGKSVTALAVLRLLPGDGAATTAGQAWFGGHDLLRADDRQMRGVRGIGMVFQDPSTALNPILTVGHQVREGLGLHMGLRRAAASARAEELLALVRIPSPRACLAKYPHELSGGMKQRVMIAMALSCDPVLLIADEPTTALDVTTQAQILALLCDLQARLGMAIVLITHDLGVVAEFADDVVVMYAGRVVERAPAAALFRDQRHPYTAGLLHCMPSLEEEDPPVLPAIPGMVASAGALPPGCAFHPRCGLAEDDCTRTVPKLAASGEPGEHGHLAACIRTMPAPVPV